MNLASSGQRRKIFLLAKQMDMDSELLHAYIHARVGKDSIRKLTIQEAVRVIDGLSGESQKDAMSQAQKNYLVFLAKRAGWVDGQGELAEESQKDAMSQAQKNYLVFLAKRAGWVDGQGELAEERLNGFCRKEYHVLYWTSLTKKNACRAIEALKNMAERGKGDERAAGAAV